jgi:hypothetical protein
VTTDATTRRLRSLAADGSAEPLPPSRVDLERVVQVGRRRRRIRGLVGVGTVGVAVTTVVVLVAVLVGPLTPVPRPKPDLPLTNPSPSGTTACRVERLTSPWPDLTNLVMDPTGRYLAGYVDHPNGGQRHAVLWTAGRFTELTVPVPAPTPVAVNAHGMVAGLSTRNGVTSGWLLHDGRFVELHAPAGATNVFLHGMNANGDVVGEAEFADGRSVAAVWWFGSTKATMLSGTGAGGAFAIDDEGTAYGTLGDGDQPIFWPKGQAAQRLADPDGGPGGKIFSVAGHWAIGVGSADPNGSARWVVWNLTTRSSRWTASLGLAEVYGVNAQGWLAGTTETVGSGKPQRPAVRRNGTTQLLPALSDDQFKGIADGVSADGHTVTGVLERGIVDPTRGATAPPARVIWHC